MKRERLALPDAPLPEDPPEIPAELQTHGGGETALTAARHVRTIDANSVSFKLSVISEDPPSERFHTIRLPCASGYTLAHADRQGRACLLHI